MASEQFLLIKPTPLFYIFRRLSKKSRKMKNNIIGAPKAPNI